MPTELGQLLRLVLLMGLIKAACAHNGNAMPSPRRRKVATEATNTVATEATNAVIENNTTTVVVTNAYVGSFGNVVLKMNTKLPSIQYDAVTKTTAQNEIDEISISLRAFIRQLIAVRPEVADMYGQVKLAHDDKKPALLSAFIRLMTRGASYDVESILHSAGQQFEDGTIARYDGYTYNIVAATFADSVEAKLQPKSVEDDLAMFGF